MLFPPHAGLRRHILLFLVRVRCLDQWPRQSRNFRWPLRNVHVSIVFQLAESMLVYHKDYYQGCVSIAHTLFHILPG